MTQHRTIIVLIIFALLSCIHCVDEGDWVDPTRLPIDYFAHPFFAGYLNISQTQAFYYVYFQSEGNPSKDPLVLNLADGLGFTSLRGLLYSKGPFIFLRNSTDFRHNPLNWNKNANLLFIDGPAGVGFSYGEGDVRLNDERSVRDTFLAILKFYEKFPELKDQDLYMTASHYGGITIPQLSKKIIQYNRDPDTQSWTRINLKGFLLTNPCTTSDECSFGYLSKYSMEFLSNHYFITRQLYRQYQEACVSTFIDGCKQITQRIQAQFLNTGSDPFNVYKDCLHQDSKYKCIDHIGINAFFSSPEVKEDMNAQIKIQWDLLNSTIYNKYQRNTNGSYAVYKDLLNQGRLKIWIVSGLLSAEVPTTGTKNWIELLKQQMNLPTHRLWQSWMFNNTIHAGYVQEMRGLTFATVRSAGFQIFEDQPEIGFQLYTKFITNSTL